MFLLCAEKANKLFLSTTLTAVFAFKQSVCQLYMILIYLLQHFTGFSLAWSTSLFPQPCQQGHHLGLREAKAALPGLFHLWSSLNRLTLPGADRGVGEMATFPIGPGTALTTCSLQTNPLKSTSHSCLSLNACGCKSQYPLPSVGL